MEKIIDKNLGLVTSLIRQNKKLKSILKVWELRSLKEPKIKYYKVNEIVIKIILAIAQRSKVFEQDLIFIVEYLDEIEEWGRYELWIFANCLKLFDDNALRYYGPRILSKANLLNSLYQNEQIFLRTILNIIDTWLYKNDLGQALKYINYMKGIDIKIEFFYEKIILRYHEAHYNVLLGRKENVNIMLDCADTLHKFGFSEEANVLFEEINLFK